MASKSVPCLSPEILHYAKALFEESLGSQDGIDKFCKTQGMTRQEYDSFSSETSPAGEFDRFLQYLTSPESNAMAPAVTDTSHPISDYYVSSSHNTYLWGNQLYGKASAEAYRNVRWEVSSAHN